MSFHLSSVMGAVPITVEQVRLCRTLEYMPPEEYNEAIRTLMNLETALQIKKLCVIVGFRGLMNRLFCEECTISTLAFMHRMLHQNNRRPAFTVTVGDFDILMKIMAATTDPDILSAVATVMSFILSSNLSKQMVDKIEDRSFWSYLRLLFWKKVPGIAKLICDLLMHMEYRRRKEECNYLVSLCTLNILNAGEASYDLGEYWRMMDMMNNRAPDCVDDMVQNTMNVITSCDLSIAKYVALRMLNTIWRWEFTPAVLYFTSHLLSFPDPEVASAAAVLFRDAKKEVLEEFYSGMNPSDVESLGERVSELGEQGSYRDMSYTLMIWDQMLTLAGFYSSEMVEFCYRMRETPECREFAERLLDAINQQMMKCGTSMEEMYGDIMEAYNIDDE